MKLGLFGWRCYTGIGSQNYDLWRTGMLDCWLSPNHPNGLVPCYDPPGDVRICRVAGERQTYRRFVRSIDCLVLVERPMLADFDLIGECHTKGKPVILIANWEWFPPVRTPWVQCLSAIWCPNQRCYDHLAVLFAQAGQVPRCELVLGGWGALLSEWPFRVRERAGKFVFVAGHGGVERRKGEDVVRRAAELTPGVPWVVHSQRPLQGRMPPNVAVAVHDVHDRRDLYREGDVMVLPSRWEGCGLSFYEAQACGMPVLCPNAEPMRSVGVPYTFGTLGERFQELNAVPWRYQEPDPQDLARVVRSLHGSPVADRSSAARAWIEQHGNLQVVAGALRGLAERLVRK